MSNKQIIGHKIKEVRIKKQKTQDEIAKYTGLSRSYISDIENGRYMPSVETLIKLASCLEMDLNFLLKMTEIQEELKGELKYE